jgi:hypothetical protein
MLYIFDIDGVLADITHLLPLIQGKEKDFETYYKRIGEAKPIPLGVSLLQGINKHSHERVWFLTGRSEVCKDITIQWLQKHGLCGESPNLRMRANGDERYADVVKRDLIQRACFRTGIQYDRMLCFEDDTNVARMYKQLGCYVCHVKHDKARSR